MKHAGQQEIANVVVEAGDQAVRDYVHSRIAPLARFAPEPTDTQAELGCEAAQRGVALSSAESAECLWLSGGSRPRSV